MNVLITGASSGIGEALAIYYAKNKVKTLFLCGRNEERLMKVKKVCEDLGATVFAKIVDISNRFSTQNWIEECDRIDRIDLVIANAGVSTIEETPDNIFNTFSVNVNGVLNTVTPITEIFKKRKNGQIAIVASIAGYHGLPSCPSYSASKACVKAYGEALRGSLKKFGIKVNVICPGFIRSRITDQNTCPMPMFMEADKAAKIIAKRLKRNVGLIAFPWPMRFASWVVSILPNGISGFIYERLYHKV